MGRNGSISAERNILLANDHLYYAIHLKTIFIADVFTRAAIFVLCPKRKTDLTCSTWTITGQWTDEKFILKSLVVHHWPNPVLSKLSHIAYNTHNSRTLKKDSWRLDFRRQSHFHSKVSLISTCNDTFKWNPTVSDSALRKLYDFCPHLCCSESSPVVPVRYSKLSVVLGPVANNSDTHNANQTLSLAFRVTSVQMDQPERALGSRLALSWQIMRGRCRKGRAL